ncbi:MAG: PP2C family protein-serine/threonine phosphatase [Proteobacteria bacterium]|nr:PP2C family protein-serine/threonine phosphatase [Pseudomonadota bacterium]
MNARLPLLRNRIVQSFLVSASLIVAVVVGSSALLWRWEAERLAKAEQAIAETRWSLALEQAATFYETVGLPLVRDPGLVGALDRDDRDSIMRQLEAALAAQTDYAPIVRIDLANESGLIASSAGRDETMPMVDSSRLSAALRPGYPVESVERHPSGTWLFVVTVPGPAGTFLSIASDMNEILPGLENADRDEMFIVDNRGNLAVSNNSEMWELIRDRVPSRATEPFGIQVDRKVFQAVPMSLRNSAGAEIGRLLVLRDTTVEVQRTRLIMLIGGFGTLLLLLGSGFTLYVLTREALDPLADITQSVRLLADGNLLVNAAAAPASREIADIAAAFDVFRANAIDLDRRKVREQLHDAEQYSLIRAEMARLAYDLDEPARDDVLAGLRQIEATGAAGAAALAAAFQMMTKSVTAQHRQVRTLLDERTRDLQTVRDALAAREQLDRMREELELARHVQMSSLPSVFPPFPDRTDLNLFASMQPAREVGGDFYDFAMLENDRLVLLIGDASGKGMSAALFIATCRALLRAALLRGAGLAEALATTNAAIAADNQLSMFATVFAAILDLRCGAMRYSNAGHNPPYVLRADGTLTTLSDAGNIALGVIDPFTFVDAEIQLSPGDGLFLFTDGVTEAFNPEQTMFGEESLEQVLVSQPPDNAEAVVRRVADAVAAFATGSEQSDDITMLHVRYLGQGDVHSAGAVATSRLSAGSLAG